jgi:Ferritin-like
MREIVRLITVPEERRDARWLEEGLQAAIQLEMSTIPPYLYAAWSIDENADPSGTRGDILEIAREGMLHMGIACNLLAAVGGDPRILQIAPSYPTRLPKDIHEDLPVALEPLSRDLLLNTFMAIEEPVAHLVDDPEFVPSGSTLIGDFYDKIQQAFEARTPVLSTTRQVNLRSFSKGTFIMASLDDVRKGIDLIKRQGEGTAAAPFEKSNPDELAHFYQFGEMAHGHRLTRTAPFTYTGEDVEMPGVREVAPAEGTQPEAREFNQLYSDMLGDLERAWAGGGTAMLTAAVGKMFGLAGIAKQLFQGDVGPGFIVIDDSGNR